VKHDLIDAFNAHIHTIRSSDEKPEWGTDEIEGTDIKQKYNLFLKG
jgi:hypothetical protein